VTAVRPGCPVKLRAQIAAARAEYDPRDAPWPVVVLALSVCNRGNDWHYLYGPKVRP
jgi:hypothetical protein